MKHLQDIVSESLLDDEDEIFDKGKCSGLISRIFSKDLDERREAFSDLESLIESHNPKQHKNTAKMKSSYSYFIEFGRPIKVENGESTNEVLDWISDITICKQNESLYKIITIGAYNDTWGGKISAYEVSWRHAQPNFNPKASNTKLYEVSEELNDLFKQIQMEAYNQIKTNK